MNRFLAILSLLTVFSFGVSPTAIAATDIFSGVDCSAGSTKSGKTSDTAVCTSQTDKDPISGENGLLHDITNIVAYVAGAAAIIIIIVAGIRYITSNGDSNNIASAKNTLIGALIGLVIIVVARALINYIVNRL